VTGFAPVTLITGASAGIGAALSEIFARHGHRTVLVARRQGQLTALADAIGEDGHPAPRILAMDLAQPDAPAQLAAALRDLGVEPAYVVNNAGFGLFGAAASLDPNEQLAMIDLNVRALTDLSLRFVDSLERHRGGILNVSSVAGFMPGPGMAVYHATKAYVISFSEALHHELKPRGIRVTALCPGPVQTEFQELAGIPDEMLPRRLMRVAGRVAEDGYDGLMRGRRLVVPGYDNKVAALLPRLIPRAWMLALIQLFQRSAVR